MKNKNILIYITAIIIVLIGGYGIYSFLNKDNLSSNTTNRIDMNLNTDDGDEKIDWNNYKNTSYTLTKSINITEEGVYNLTGTITEGLITVNTSGNVKLVLNNVNITNPNGPAILIENASDVIIELKEGSKNYLEDGTNYIANEEDEAGTILSHDDLTFEGSGTLEVVSNTLDAIVSKDDLKFISGTYIIKSKDDGIRGKDSVYIINGNYTITSSGDGIKTTNDTDTEKGFVKIENGTFIINAENDGIDSVNKILIQDGNFDITTGGGSSNSSTTTSWGNWGGNTTNNSAKGIKAGDNILIESGEFKLNSSDDAIHSNNYIGIKNGNFTILSGDDGIHADEELIIDGGNINIDKSYEGLEALKITINNGNISVVASDDGINVAGGSDSSSLGARPGRNNFSESTGGILTINGGSIKVDSTGDGLDANGSIYITGGNTIVYGPTNNGNGALDYDQTCEITGGTLIAGGASGMLQGLNSSSTIYNLTITFNSNYSNGDTIKIIDSNNKEIASYSSSKTFSSLVIASPDLKKDETYRILVNDEEYSSFTISNITTNIGNNGGMNMPGGRR